MITQLNIQRVENGYTVRYWEKGNAKERVFLSWESLCDWMRDQVGQDPKSK